jgi:hypothetical protein
VNPNFKLFKNKITNALGFRWFMFTQLPSAWFAGLRIEELSEEKAVISVRQKWFNKNPFKSIYVAILSMPAEVSTGILCMGALYKRNPSVSMLAVGMEGSFIKKATGKILFTCADGKQVNEAVENALATGEAVTIKCHSTGRNEHSEVVAEFYFIWSFKARSTNTAKTS